MKSPLILACVLALVAAPALADNKGKGKSHKNNGHVVAACPPGLAKKSPACVPPGQAKKAVRVDDDTVILRISDRHYRIGDRLIEPHYHYITRPALYGLDPLYDGSRYVIVGNNLLRVDSDTLQLLALIRIVDSILD
jgi:hypothetical protein